MVESLGKELDGEIFVDSSAALGVVARKGCGKLRHVKVGQLWIQEIAEAEEVNFRKILGDINPADIITKHLTRIRMDKLLDLAGLYDRDGRADMVLEISFLHG